MRAIDRRAFLVAVCGSAAAAAVASARTGHDAPAAVMLMRHGEDNGVHDVNLAPRGYRRAQALPRLFAGRLPAPQIVVATRASKSSNRPVETVEPLARALHLPIDNRFREGDYALLAHDVLNDPRYAGKVVLVCWHHGTLRKLARALGVAHAPDWPNAQFDHIWVIDYTHGRPRLEDVHQRLLDGDA